MKDQFYFKSLKNVTAFCLAVCAIAFLFSGCGKTEDPTPVPPTAGVAVIQMSDATSPAQDAYINNIKLNSSPITYGVVLGYYLVQTGPSTVDFKNASTGALSASVSLTTVENKTYSVVYGDNNAIVKAEDDQTSPQSGKARIRFLNVSGYLNQNVDFGGAGGNKVVLNLPLNTVSDYYEVDPTATTSITVYPAGTTTPTITTNVGLLAGHAYYYIVSGTTTGSVKGLLLTQF